MRRHIIMASLVFLLGSQAWCDVASAQEVTQAGNFVFSIERLFGFYVDHQSVDVGPTDVETDTTDFSLAWNAAPTPMTQPRLAFDYFIDENFTLGGSFGVFSISSDTGPRNNNNDYTGILFGVRGGYALRLGHAFAFWPRVGFTYTSVNADAAIADQHMFGLALEGMFTLAPAENWAFLAGPTIDLGISGELADNPMSETCFGIMFGMLGYFGN